ncbi:MAG: hypothetical protein AMXMBFR58_38800 [Phycisphaerae bacterium]
MEREDIEKLDVDAVAGDSPTARSVLAVLKTLILKLFVLLTELRTTLAAQQAEIAELSRVLFGPKSERTRSTPPRPKPTASPEDAAARRVRGRK